jgi:hypothetical protein
MTIESDIARLVRKQYPSRPAFGICKHLTPALTLAVILGVPALANPAYAGGAEETLICRQANEPVRTTPNVDPRLAEKLRQKDLQRIEAAKRGCEQMKAEYAEQEKQEAIRAEKYRKEQEEYRRQVNEMQQRYAEQERARQAELAKPHNQLRTAYYGYMYVRACYNVRKGYVYVWINDEQLESARRVVERKEKLVLQQDSTLDTEAIWQQTAAKLPRLFNQAECQIVFNELMLSVPALPQQKDFGS